MAKQRIRTTPGLLGAILVRCAAKHYDSIRESLLEIPPEDVRKRMVPPTERQWDAALAELLRAGFCLASIRVGADMDDDSLNLYGFLLLTALRQDQYPGSNREFVRRVFSDEDRVREAVDTYAKGRLSPEDNAAVAQARGLLGYSDSEGSRHFSFPFFCLVAHVRLMRLLDVTILDRRFIPAWWGNALSFTALWEVLSECEPDFADNAANHSSPLSKAARWARSAVRRLGG
jgi:hypothetical protein